MPTPIGFDRNGANLTADTPEAERTTTLEVFTISNRSVDPMASASEFLTDRRSFTIRLLTLRVDLGPPGGTWPEFARAAETPGRLDGPPLELSSVKDFGGVWPGPKALEPRLELGPEALDQFAAAIDASIARTGGEDLFVYVHGFDTTVRKNSAYTAELFSFLGRRGAAILFAWPSAGELLEYGRDKTSARASVRGFRKTLQLLGSRTRAERIHILGHSAGAPIVLGALDELRLLNDDIPPGDSGKALKIGRVVLAAPDMDFWESFSAIADGATDLAERVTIYDNRSDHALGLAQWICGGPRLGRSLAHLDDRDLRFLEQRANIDVIDVTNAERHVGEWLGHRYFYRNPWVSTDVLLTLITDATPAERGLSFDEPRGLFVFGNDYPERVPAIARGLIARSESAPTDGPAAEPDTSADPPRPATPADPVGTP